MPTTSRRPPSIQYRGKHLIACREFERIRNPN
jgi:hypothetical protein